MAVLKDNYISPGSAEARQKEINDFKRILSNYFPDQKAFSGKRILNIGCGPVTEEPALNEYFSPSKLVSIDNCEYRKEDAIKNNRKSFVFGDLRELEKILSEKDRFDIIIGRNVPLSPGGTGTYPGDFMRSCTDYKPVTENDMWLGIFRKIKGFCEEKSTMFLTFLRTDEFLRAEKILEKINYSIIKKEENSHLCFSDGIGVAHGTKDHFIILAQ